MQSADVMTTPNAARVYDYLLGGRHNFEVDRQAAAVMTALLPTTPIWLRRLRRFLHQSVVHLAAEGFDSFLDLASGLPTDDHIHATAPGARVVYVDSDPLVVEYGRKLIGTQPHVRYLQADLRDIDGVLGAAPVQEVLGGAGRLAIGLNAVTCFLSDDDIARVARTLYDWAPDGSRVFATFETKAPEAMTPKLEQFLAMFEQMGTTYHFLTLERAKELMQPWQPDRRGFQALSDLLEPRDPVAPDEREGVDLEFYGAILQK